MGYKVFLELKQKNCSADLKNSLGFLFVNELAIVIPTIIKFGPLSLILVSIF